MTRPAPSRSLAHPGGFWAVVFREWRLWSASPVQIALVAALPLLGGYWWLSIFHEPAPRDLPVALLDLDRSPLAREIADAIDAAPHVRIASTIDSLGDGQRLLRQGRVYAVVVLPPAIRTQLGRGESVHLSAFYDAQAMLASSLVARDLQAVSLWFAAALETRAAASRGVPVKASGGLVAPLRARTHLLFNPGLNYHDYLLAPILAAMLQMFVTMGAAMAFGREFKEQQVTGWMAAAGGRLRTALVAKAFAIAVWGWLLGAAALAVIFDVLGAPLRGRLALLAASLVLFVLACIGIAMLVVALTANLRVAVSVIAFYTGIAFAFMGITFPRLALPPVARLWGELLPVTHFTRVLFEESLRAGDMGRGGMGHSGASLVILTAFALIPAAAAAWPFARLIRGQRAWSSR